MLGDGGEKVIAKKEKRGEGAPLLRLPFSLPFPSSSITIFSHTGLTVWNAPSFLTSGFQFVPIWESFKSLFI